MTVMPLPVEVPYTRPSGLTVPRAVSTDDLAAGDDDRVAAGALTSHADAADDPGAIEIVAATSAAFSRRAARFVGLGLAASRGF